MRFFESLYAHLELEDLLEQLSLFGMNLLLVLGFLAPREQLAGSVEQLPLPLDHMDGVNGVISRDLLDRLAAADHLQATRALNSGLWVRRLLMSGSPISGAIPHLRG